MSPDLTLIPRLELAEIVFYHQSLYLGINSIEPVTFDFLDCFVFPILFVFDYLQALVLEMRPIIADDLELPFPDSNMLDETLLKAMASLPEVAQVCLEFEDGDTLGEEVQENRMRFSYHAVRFQER